MVKRFLAGLTLAAVMISSPLFAATVPALKGRVNDYAKIIRDSDEREIEEYLAGLEQASGIQIAVLTMYRHSFRAGSAYYPNVSLSAE